MPDTTGGRVWVERHLERAENALTVSTGGKAVCAISWSADVRPPVKYREGAVSSLAELRRRLRRDQVSDTVDDLLRALGGVHAGWHSRMAEMAVAGPAWEAYFRGGLDALERLAEDLRPL